VEEVYIQSIGPSQSTDKIPVVPSRVALDGGVGVPQVNVKGSVGVAGAGGVFEKAQCNDDDVEEEEAEPAVCAGHSLDDRGLVFMRLVWKDKKEEPSWGNVRSIMCNRAERKAYSNTWLQYCDSWGMQDDLFRMMGVSVVECIEGHDWAECGHPVARIRWRHGEVTTSLVVKAMETRGDRNGFKAAWDVYSAGIDGASEGFKKGHVDKSRRQEGRKRPRGSK
jgi:hypothetical protein